MARWTVEYRVADRAPQTAHWQTRERADRFVENTAKWPEPVEILSVREMADADLGALLIDMFTPRENAL